jgi:thiamine-phosphate pyrophosphorylase
MSPPLTGVALTAALRVHAIVSDVASAEQAVQTGATTLQLRMKGMPTAAVIAAGRALYALPAMLVINDDVDAALELGTGVHLGDDDPGAERALAAGLLVGRSASDPRTALARVRQGAGYVGAGPVWATASKPDAGIPIGVGGLSEVCAAVGTPVVAIGGVDAARAGACIAAGAAGVAVIRAVSELAAVRAAVDAALAQRSAAGNPVQLRRTT